MINFTLQQIASEAGVSVSTVSRALAGKKVISPKTRARVHEALERLQAAAERNAPGPLSGSLVGFFIPQAMSYFSTHTLVNQTLTEAIREHAQRQGCNLVIGNWSAGEGPATPGDALLRDKRLCGAVFARTRASDEGHLDALAASPYPVVVVNRVMHADRLFFVGVQHERVGRLAAQHLIRLGHTKLGLLCGPQDTQSFAGRARGFRAEAAEAGIPVPPEWMLTTDLATDSVRQSVARVLDLPERPTGLFVGNDRMALVVLQEAQRRGLHVPRDLSVVGVDGLSEGELAVPPLTSVEIPWAVMGRVAVDVISQAVMVPAMRCATITLDVSLATRDSTAPPPG